MLARTLMLSGAAAFALAVAATPALAQWHGHPGWGDRDWHHHWHPPGPHPWVYTPPPVYYAPPAPYYAAPPGVSFSLNIP